MDSIFQKLAEAKRLYQDAINCFEANDNEYIHYLNACVNSARSVTFVMQKIGRNPDKSKFDIWYEQEKIKIFDEQDKDFVILRNISDHQKPINSKQRVFSGTVGEPNKKFENVQVRFNLETLTAEAISTSNGKKIIVPTSPINKDIVVEEFDDDKKKIIRKEHFIKNLGSYLSKLEKMVENFTNFMKA
ncbi:hypothetical protein A2215_04645 [Candidatus Berkelbacteria bacterium RIFOXYA2_FULL_43_10]|uniref:Uncharacterized protein n=1 Tax=Candidatus Berkelbacteria bacterium RIFOXYA2_FULL_43_10 TaxID=1797472 RepID=A0A1F5E762_9BACT|nr:MAG: hypothetical protein A2215_04645 [Candidatus Berkelbacteria bacterium RIFOXYA2_FULL_43_10]